jgi:hypothetical protein
MTTRAAVGSASRPVCVVVNVFGTLRDFVVAWQRPDVMALSPGTATVLIDMMLWCGLTALAQVVMRLLAGSAAADRLAYRPWLPKRVKLYTASTTR